MDEDVAISTRRANRQSNDQAPSASRRRRRLEVASGSDDCVVSSSRRGSHSIAFDDDTTRSSVFAAKRNSDDLSDDTVPGKRRRKRDPIQEAEERYIDEAVYRQQGVPQAEQPDDNSSEATDGASESEELIQEEELDELPEEHGGPSDEASHLFDFDRLAFGKAVMTLKSKHRASNRLLQSMLKMTLAFFPAYHPPPSLYQVLKDIGRDDSYVKRLVYKCPRCCQDLHQTTRICNNAACSCLGKVDRNLNIGIAELYLKPQIQRIIAAFGSKMVSYFNSRYRLTPLLDFVGSPYYEDLLRDVEHGVFCVNLIAHVDSAPLEAASTLSLTPIQLVVAELPPSLRWSLDNLVVPCFQLSLSVKSVDYRGMWSYVESELERCDDIVINIDGRTVKVKVQLAFIAADLVCKCKIIGMKQFNGYYSCWFCKARGVWLQSRHLYLEAEVGELRTSEHFIQEYADIRNDFPGRFGFTDDGPSCPVSLESKMPFAVPADPLHCCYLGVVKRMLQALNTPKNKLIITQRRIRAEFEIGRFVKHPSFIHRKFRSLEDLPRMKASELQYWLLLLPAYLNCIKNEAFHVLCALHSAFVLLEGDRINYRVIDRAAILLRAVHASVEHVFSVELLGTNFHLLLHLAEQCRQMGPLWAAGTQAFEGHLYSLSRMVSEHANRGFLNTIAENFSLRCLTLDAPTAQLDATGCVSVGVEKDALLTDEEIACLDFSGLGGGRKWKSLRKVKQGTVSYAAGLEYGDSNACFDDGCSVKYGRIMRLLRRGREFVALIRLQPVTNDCLAKFMGPAPESLADCFEDGLYSREFLLCEPGTGDMVAVNCVRLVGLCLYVKNTVRQVFVTRLARHSVHD